MTICRTSQVSTMFKVKGVGLLIGIVILCAVIKTCAAKLDKESGELYC